MPFTRLPPLPSRIAVLDTVLANLRWTWHAPTRALLRSVDPDGFDAARSNPYAFRRALAPARLRALAADPSFVERLDHVAADLFAYLGGQQSWWKRHHGERLPGGIAYFSAEFGIHEGLPIYSGGLGVLAGDHVKSASDLGIPLVAVGLFYRDGYFSQSIVQGQQHERYISHSPADLGLRRAVGAGGQPLEVLVPLANRHVRCEVFQADVGRVPLYLLDTDVVGNLDEDRWLCRRLYGGDGRTRIAQEMVLGIGGLRALRAAGHRPDVVHMNEGHTAFVVLERLREEVQKGLAPDEALAAVRAGSIFTTHTPVPAGHDRFDTHLVDEMLGRYRQQVDISPTELMDLGRVERMSAEDLCMTVLAMRGARATNAVSAKHGEVTRAMWQGLFPGSAVDRVPIGHVTNGVHPWSWLAPEIVGLLDEQLGPEWREALVRGAPLRGVEAIDDAALWAAKKAGKFRLLAEIAVHTGETLDENALLIGFARRFAPYKRGDLVLADVERLRRILNHSERPVRIVYAGKSHPRDKAGKDIIHRVLNAAKEHGLEGRVVFLPDYDIGLGRKLVQGCDLWLNNPRRPLEASGTSGQKVALNGGLNASTLDGWWIEGYDADALSGFSIGGREVARSDEEGDREDGAALYQVLEREIVPCYFDREGGLPKAWIRRMKRAIATCLPAFNTHRMLADYVRIYTNGR